MPKVEKGEVRVTAICNGSVIDHIPVDHLMKVVQLLGLEELEHPMTIGNNYKSKKLGRKGIIKIENKFFSPDQVSMLALISPEIVINVIRNYDVVEKIKVELPEEITGLVRCTNPKCISNNEAGMLPRFKVLDKRNVRLQCRYCTRKIDHDDLVISTDLINK